jgi:hypothetical protein
MKNGREYRAISLALGVLVALCIGCAHALPYAAPGGGGTPSPGPSSSPGSSPSPGSSASPANCGVVNPNATIYIAMTSTATATNDPNYGVVNGFTDIYDSSNAPSNVANVILARPTDVIQFVNLEPLGPNPSPSASPSIIDHSGAAFPSSFPSPSYSFPPQETSQLGSVISSQPWSTGPIGQDFSGQFICYSQSFTLPSTNGTFYFGDLHFYGLSNMRDLVVVSTSRLKANPREARPPFRRAAPPAATMHP